MLRCSIIRQNGNLMVERLCGAHIHLVTKEEYARFGQAKLGETLVASLRAKGKNPMLIPVGGSNRIGAWGYLNCVEELRQQFSDAKEHLDRPFTDIAMACGSGGTTAGLAIGNQLVPWGSGKPLSITAYMVCDNEQYFQDHIDTAASELGIKGWGSSVGSGAAAAVRFVQAKGAGYALSRSEELETITAVASSTGIVLDNVYTAKAVHAMLEEIRKSPDAWEGRKIVFVHTGGMFGLYDAITSLQPFVAKLNTVQRLHV